MGFDSTRERPGGGCEGALLLTYIRESVVMYFKGGEMVPRICLRARFEAMRIDFDRVHGHE